MAAVNRKSMRMSDEEQARYLDDHKFGRLATVSSDGEPHVAPVGYVSVEGRIYFHGLKASRRGRHIAEGSQVCLCVDDGVGETDEYRDRTGVVLYGRCRELVPDEDVALLDRVRGRFGEVFFGDRDASYERSSHAWYELTSHRSTSWDFSKIPSGADRFAR